MEKQMVRKTVLDIQQDNPVLWKQVKDFEFEDDDVLRVGHQEETWTSNGGYSDHFYFDVERMVLETDKQYEERIEHDRWWKKELKDRRRENYLKLKKEFENDTL